MKKQALRLTRLAAAAAFAAAFSVQAADCSIYGIVDTGIIVEYNKMGSQPSSTSAREEFGVNLGPRIGLTGTEDLGNGTKVKMLLENLFESDDGEMLFSRLWGGEASLALEGSMGEIAFGRMGALVSPFGHWGIFGMQATPFGFGWGRSGGMHWMGGGERRAAVRAAEDWGTYVMVHVYNPRGIARALKAGVRSIEHGHLIDEPTMALLAESGAWLSMQAFAVEDNTYPSPVQQAKHLQICNGTDRTYRLAKKHGVKLAWGTDLLFDPANTKNQNHGIVKLQKWFTNFEILRMVTCDNARLLALSGARNPYPGNLGVIEEGALADLLVIEGNPLERIEVLENPHDNLRVIVKDGVVCKNTL